MPTPAQQQSADNAARQADKNAVVVRAALPNEPGFGPGPDPVVALTPAQQRAKDKAAADAAAKAALAAKAKTSFTTPVYVRPADPTVGGESY